MKICYGFFIIYIISIQQTQVLGLPNAQHEIQKAKETDHSSEEKSLNVLHIRNKFQTRLREHPERAEIANFISDNIDSIALMGRRRMADLAHSTTGFLSDLTIEPKARDNKKSCEGNQGILNQIFGFLTGIMPCLQDIYYKALKILQQLAHDYGSVLGTSDLIGKRFEVCKWNMICYLTAGFPAPDQIMEISTELSKLGEDALTQFVDLIKLELFNIGFCVMGNMGGSNNKKREGPEC